VTPRWDFVRQANRRLIELFEAKTRARIKEVWGE
jgi:hypothetical protein